MIGRKNTYVVLEYYWIDFDGCSLGPMIHDAIHQYRHRYDSPHWFQSVDYATKWLEYSQPFRIDKPPAKMINYHINFMLSQSQKLSCHIAFVFNFFFFLFLLHKLVNKWFTEDKHWNTHTHVKSFGSISKSNKSLWSKSMWWICKWK